MEQGRKRGKKQRRDRGRGGREGRTDEVMLGEEEGQTEGEKKKGG